MYFDNAEPSRDIQATSIAPNNLIGVYFDQLRGEILNLLSKDASYQVQVQKLETELAVYKRAYADLDAEKRQYEKLKQEADKRRDDLENQLKGHRIITLVDGDGAIFTNQLIAQGQAGGHKAALMLSDYIVQHLTTAFGANHYQLWVYVFLNKRGLLETLGRFGLGAAKTKFEEFITGFNQAAERFIMVDVGSAKEAADAKIKVLLESEIRMPQTEKIIFGGCHDNGYVTTLRSHITAGFKHKLILLPSYTEIAAGIYELDLPILTIPDLFMSSKLTFNNTPPTNPTPPNIALIDSTQLQPVTDLALATSLDDREAQPRDQTLDVLPFASLDLVEPRSSPRPLLLTSYSSAVRASPKKSASTPELDSSSGSTSSSDENDDVSIDRRASPALFKTRRINPTVPLSKQKPPPCALFYLANCRHGAECKYGHDYVLQPEHFNEIRQNAKKSPCPAANKGEVCLWGEDCCYGHKCPHTMKCHFLKQGRCKFTGCDMHKEPKDQIEMA